MLTQEQYTLYTGENVCYSDEQWALLVGSAEMRIASFLCLEELPEDYVEEERYQDFAILVANFLCAMLKYLGTPDTIDSKSVRNFTIKFKSSATNAFEQIYLQYRDTIEKYSDCGLGVDVERGETHFCGRCNGLCV